VRLAALDLREISGVDLEGPVLNLGIPGITCSPKFMCFSLSVNVTFLCKFRRIQCRCRSLKHITFRTCSETALSYEARAYPPPLASNTLLVPSRLAFLQRSASGTVLPAA